MTLASQVCSLDLAKRLKELGVKQDGYFAWYLMPPNEDGDAITHLAKALPMKKRWSNDWCSAFTLSELGEMLPLEVQLHYKNGKPRASKHHLAFGIYRVGKEYSPYWVAYFDGKSSLNIDDIRADNEADARAKMLVYLLESKLITV